MTSIAFARPIRVLAVSRNIESADFQQRMASYAPLLAARGIEVTSQPMPHGFWGQRRMAKQAADYDLVWWHKYLPSPWLPDGWNRRRHKLVFDFADPIIYGSHATSDRPDFTRLIKFRRHVRRCSAVFAASQTLVDQALPYNTCVHVIPMAVDVPTTTPRLSEPITLLWLGGKATYRYLAQMKDTLDELGKLRPNVTLRIVGHQEPPPGGIRIDFRQWSPQQEQEGLSQCHIGLCPMPDTPWTRGKCPYKVLQYMANGMTWVGSAVGENIRQAGPAKDDQFRGLCASDNRQWLDVLTNLIDHPELCRAAGERGRQHILLEHSREVLAGRIAEVFRRLVSIK